MPPTSSSAFLPIQNGSTDALWVWGGMVAALVLGLVFLMTCKSRPAKRWRWLSRLGVAVLSSEPYQQARIWRYLVSGVNYTAGLLALNYGAERGVIDVDACRHLTLSAVVAMAGFYVVLRAGWNKAFADPALIEPQMMGGIVFMAWGYLIGGPGRPIALLVLFVILMFGLFTVTVRQMVRVSIAVLAVFGGAFLAVGILEQGTPFMAEMQILYFGMLVVILISAYLLVKQLALMRARAFHSKRELAEALAKLQGQVIHDELTGLFNRRHMQHLLSIERARAGRSGHPWCVGMLDLDHFKEVNDRYGHRVGDEVLCATAQAISEGLREADQVARWGGEEFLVLLPDTDCEGAMQVLDRIRQALARKQISQTVPALRVTFSAGLTVYIDDEPLPQTVDRADQALYMAKLAGRNRTERLDMPGELLSEQALVR